jgi:hypothetical protein
MTIDRTDKPYVIMDSIDDIWGLLDWIDVALTWLLTAITPVSPRAKYSRWNMVMIQYPRGDKFRITATAREAGILMRKAGVVCGMIGFDHDYTYWLIRRSQIDWAMHLMGGEPGGELNRPKQFWTDNKGRVRTAATQAPTTTKRPKQPAKSRPSEGITATLWREFRR